ncbi:NAD(P)-dependent dehydrogenase (short-subunit alcohol dehydrogenase family) [Rhodoligotrophos appendicifer]|uniref:SDR family NAD(P)-dependent oxidoreductase n=1 Tax=Rhodoligotrophos appendicifer TaxID=987056 RepID=UPI0011854976|nr:SDR family NAD(P)-dependent oxidoreductase [Rhodoligotrophos appendicifer]
MKIDNATAAIVTGGASGLGEATARRLAEDGARVALFDLNSERGEQVARDIGGIFCKVDVTDEESIDQGLARAREAHGQERILVNCAGIVIGQKSVRRKRETGEVIAHSLKDFRKVVEINLIGTFAMLSRSAAGMLSLAPVTEDGGRGVIVNTASVAATDGQMGQAAYASSKAGVMGLTLPVARDLAADGIRVMAILPGLFHTPMFDGLPDDARKSLAAGVPFPTRLGRADEYASLVRHIVDNDMLNGESIRLDGAVRLAPR